MLSTKNLFMMASLIVLTLLPELAHAVPTLFAIPDGDKSKEIFVDFLFGPLVGGGANPFGDMIATFNNAVLVVGGVLVAYTVVAGTMSTAHDGEMLGKKWSSLWVPIRTAVGTAAILPALPGGYCFAQGAVLWLAMQGIGLADNMTKAFMGDSGPSFMTASLYEPPSISRPIHTFLGNLLIDNVCAAAINKSVARHDPSTKTLLGVSALDLQKDLGMSQNGALQYVFAPSPYNPGVGLCGTVTLMAGSNVTGIKGDGDTASFLFDSDRFAAKLIPIHKKEFDDSQTALQALAAKIAAGGSEQELQAEVSNTLNTLSQHWSQAVQGEARTAIDQNVNKDLISQINKDGWLMLGAWYMQIASAQDAITKGVTTIPNGSAPPILTAGNTDGVMGVLQGTSSAQLGLLNGAWFGPDAQATVNLTTRMVQGAAVAGSPGGAVQDYADTANSEWTAKIVKWFISDDDNMFGKNMGQDNLKQNPVIMARNLGQNMTIMGWAGYGTAAAASILLTQSAAGVGTSGLAAFITPMVTAIAGAIIVSGATLSTYIPMLPYILWIGVVLGWAVLLVEAMIAAPLWAVTHLAPDGDGIVGRGGQGYMLVLSLTLRPALMVFGFAAAVVMMQPLGILINSTFIGAFISNVNPSLFGLTQMIMGCVLYAVVMISVINRVFALIHIIPDKILRWIGGGGNDLGEAAHGIESHTAAKTVAGTGAAMSLAGAAQQGAQNYRNLQSSERNKQAQDKGNLEARAATASQDSGNAGDRVSTAETRLAAAQSYARTHKDPLALNDMQAAQDDLNQSHFQHAIAQAKEAVASSRLPDATPQAKALGQQAAQFLEGASQVNPYEADKVNDFIKNNAEPNKGFAWGASLQRALRSQSRTESLNTSLADIRKNARSDRGGDPSESDHDPQER